MELSQKPIKAEKTQGRKFWCYTYADWDKACELIDKFNWDSILSQDIEQSWKLAPAIYVHNGIVNTE